MSHRRVTQAVTLLAAAVLTAAIACSASPAAPQQTPPQTVAPPAPAAIDLTGTWSGNGSDIKGAEKLMWTLTQVGSSVSGPVQMTPLVQDGSCASCHKLKKGTVAGTLSGTKLTMKMTFPAGGDDETPLCSIRIEAEAPEVTGSLISATYNVDDTCEGLFSGTFALAR